VILGTDNFKQAQTGAERYLESSEFELTDAEAVCHIPGRVLRKQVQKTTYKIPKNNHSIAVDINEVEPDAAVNVLGLPEFDIGSFVHEFEQDSSSIQRPSIIPGETESITSPFLEGELTSSSKTQPGVEFIVCAGIEAKLEKLFAELQTFRIEFQKFEAVAVERGAWIARWTFNSIKERERSCSSSAMAG
ncbi:unnamed protein product, partial [Allacma fusca]